MPEERRSTAFCCAGCEAVHALLRDEGLLRFYDLGGSRTGAVGALPRVPVFDWLPGLEERAPAGPTVAVTVDVQGIRCAACVWLLQQVWKRQQGALDLRLSPSLGRAVLSYRRGSGAALAFLRDAARFGYPMAPASRRAVRDTGLLIRLGICAALAMNAMILAVSFYFGLDRAIAGAAAGDAVLQRVFAWVLAGLGTASVVVGGPVFFRTALAGLRAGVVHMDLPISLGLLLAWAGSVHGLLTGGPSYFDTVAIFVAFMLGGRFLQQRTLSSSRDVVLADDGAEHLRARRITNGSLDLVPVQSLIAGDDLLLAPGDLVPVRVQLAGPGTFSLDWINGESEPRAFGAGDEVPAGAFQGGRTAVRARVAADYMSSGLAELLGQEPVDREDTRGRVRFWHLLNRSYAIGVLVAAAASGLLWAWLDPTRALPVAISVLVITCPCAMGIATPLAFHLALALLRRRGVFVRSKSLLDKANCVKKVVFDKTGTVTFGGLRAKATLTPPADAEPVLATMAASSNHPVSHAILQTIRHAAFVPDLGVVEFPGQGLECRRGADTWRLGGREFCGLSGGPPLRRECLLAKNGELVARYELEEDFRSGAAEEIAALRERGLAVYLMSGDRPDRVRRAAAMLGIPVANAQGGMSPQDKAAAVDRLGRDDLMMIGDGLNDAPAFAAAFCAGTPAMDRPVLPARADFCFRGASAGAVDAVFSTASLLARVVRTNLALALVYNATTLVLCFCGAMTPGLCAVLMPISSAALVLHTSARLARARRRA